MSGFVARFSHWLHPHFIWVLLGSYAAAAFAPRVGLWIKNFSLNEFVLFGASFHVPLPIHVSLPTLMLGVLLLNAGLGVDTTQLRHLLRRPWPLAAGLAANLLIPLAYIFAVSVTLGVRHHPAEVQNILVGLALVAFFFNLMLTSWAIGIFVSGLILRNGMGAENLAWSIMFLFMPLACVYYPVTTLPVWLQPAAWALPPTYVFEGMRALLIDHVFRADLMLAAFGLNVVLMAGGIFGFLKLLQAARRHGSLVQTGE